ncbi:hypothetical protein OT595_15695 [Edwardsiella ictaluri]|uniref:hypothetical protein n=1 Tax=Edwardsiella ictaluri TaxID=67780 RepID=UPI00378364E0
MKYDITTPSQYHVALVERLRAHLFDGLAIESYDEFGKVEIGQPTILIQWEDAYPGPRRNDGRYTHHFMLTAHCIIPKGHPNAQLQALDLSAEVERLLERRSLFKVPAVDTDAADMLLVSTDQVGMPQIQLNGDTSFLLGLDGVESRGVQWLQPLYLGMSLNSAPDVRDRVRYSVQEMEMRHA